MKTSYRAKVRYLCSDKLSASGSTAPRPSDQGLCPWTPLGAQPPDPHFWRAWLPDPLTLRSNSPKPLISPKLEVSIGTDTRAISERFRDKGLMYKALYKFI